jgi:hypothetical protein
MAAGAAAGAQGPFVDLSSMFLAEKISKIAGFLLCEQR